MKTNPQATSVDVDSRLPITAYLDWENSKHFSTKISKEIIEQVRTLEEAQQKKIQNLEEALLYNIKKAKEEFRNSDEYKELKEKADKYDSLCK